MFMTAIILAGYESIIGPIAWSYACTATALVICFATRGNDSIDVFAPMITIMGYLAFLFGIRGIFVLNFDPYYFMPYATPGLISTALVLAITGMISTYCGYCLPFGDRIANLTPQPSFLLAGERRYPNIVIVAAAVAGLTGLALFAAVGGGHKGTDMTSSAGTFWITPLLNMLPISLLLLVLSSKGGKLTPSRVVGTSTLALGVLASFLVFSSKLFIIETVYVGLVIYHYRVRRLRMVAVASLIFAAFVVMQCIKLYLSLYSHNLLLMASNLTQSWNALWMQLFSRFYGLDSMVAILMHTQRIHYEWGSSFAELLYWWVPRAIWPNKPFSWSYQFSFILQKYNSAEAGAFSAPTFLGELYLNFGLAGLIAGSVIVGIAARAAYSYFVQGVSSKSALMMYGLVLVHLGQLCESTLAVAMALALAHIGPFAGLLVFARRVEEHDTRAAGFPSILRRA
jgi:hypothetical protein